MATHAAVCQSDAFWNACDWTTYDGTIITNATERDAYYYCKYTSFNSYDLAQARQLGENEICEILGPWATPDTPVTTSATWGTSHLYQLIIVAVGVARHQGVWSDTAYRIVRIDEVAAAAFYVGTSWAIVIGIQASYPSGYDDCFEVYSYRYGVTFIDCISHYGRYGFFGTGSNSSGIIAINCIAYGAIQTGIAFSGILSFPSYIINCTVYDCARGGSSYRHGINLNGNGKIINSLSLGTRLLGKDFAFVSTICEAINCISEDNTAVGTGCYNNRSIAECVTDAANLDFSLMSTSFPRDKGIKITDVTPVKDITGSTYRDAVIDIGAFEYDTGYIPMLQVDIKVSGIAEGSILAIYKTSNGTAIVNPTTIGASGSHTLTYDYVADTQIEIVVRKGTSGTRYLPYSAPGLITENGFALIVNQVEDTIAI